LKPSKKHWVDEMQGIHLNKKAIVFVLLIMMALTLPTQLVSASQSNQMISDEYLQNPDTNTDESPDAKEVDNQNVGLGPGDYIKMLLSLLFVLGLLVFVLKFLNKKSSNYQQNNVVKNIGGISVGSQKSVQLLHIGNSLYIVGVGEDVQLLKEIQDPEEIEQLIKIYQDKQQTIVSTSPYITELFKKLKKKPSVEETESQSDFGAILKNRLSEINKERHEELEKWKEKEHDK